MDSRLRAGLSGENEGKFDARSAPVAKQGDIEFIRGLLTSETQ